MLTIARWGVSSCLALSLVACASTSSSNLTTAHESVLPGTSVKRAGQSVALHQGKLALNQLLPEVTLVDFEWQPHVLRADGQVKLISIVPSLDTQVCEQQTHLLAQSTDLDPKVQRVVVSRDLPAAQRRFAAASELPAVTYLSDYRDGQFGKTTGLMMDDSELLTRALVVVDGEGVVRYMQVVPEITHLPDFERAIAEANKLAVPADVP